MQPSLQPLSLPSLLPPISLSAIARHDGFNFAGARVRNVRQLAALAHDKVGGDGTLAATRARTDAAHAAVAQDASVSVESRNMMTLRHDALTELLDREQLARAGAQQVLPDWLILEPARQAARFPPADPARAVGAAAPIPALDASSWTAYGDKVRDPPRAYATPRDCPPRCPLSSSALSPTL